MNEKKLKVVSLIFSLMVALAMVGGNWDISLAQGTIPRTPPPSPPAAPAPLIGSIITAGIGHTCAITPADGIRCWGLNEAGQLGDRTWVDSTVPVHVVDVLASGVTDLDAGHHHTCALTSGGRVMCWGKNDKGQLGNGTFEDSNVPVFVQGLAGITTSIHTGADFTCAVSNAGRVSCWGNNSTGQLNDGTTENRNVAVLTDPEISGIKMISGGEKEIQGVTANGGTSFWNNEPIIPVTGLPEEANEIIAADRFSGGGCTTTVEGVVNCWGAVVNADVEGAVLDRYLLDTGIGHACTVNDAGMVCWGLNSKGQLGVGNQDDSESALSVRNIQSVVDLATGLHHTCAIIDDEIIKCWGENVFGQLGDGSISDSTMPVLVK